MSLNDICDFMTGMLAAVSLLTLIMVLRRDMLMFQLNSYRNERYVRWFNSSDESTSTIRIVCCVALFVMMASNFMYVSAAAIAVLLQLWVIWRLARMKYKKGLVFTRRVARIYFTSLALTLIVGAVVSICTESIRWGAVSLIACSVLSPIFMLVANLMLRPVEQAINNRYYRDAERIMQSMPDMTVIGITGSYGKTSTKHYLHRILSESYSVVMTPGSYNTTMGVIRTIREYLEPYTQIFIVEMGAKQPGDIKEICDLVKPQIGIVTAVGEQHLESFKSIENVQRTKFELIESLPADGYAVINDDFEYVANRPVTNVAVARYAARHTDNANCIISDIKVSKTGTDFTIAYSGETYTFHTRLVGECNISNLAAAIIVALRLKVPVSKIAYAVDRIEQVEHRLNMKRTPGGVTIIDDAFNSNPTGSAMALDVLGGLTEGKRIIVTPGMIELGDKQFELNHEFGTKFAGRCDIAIVVGEYNREAIVTGAIDGGLSPDNILTAESFAHAQAMLSSLLKQGDAVLYENDLPDTFK